MFIKKDLRKIPRILADAAVVQEPPSDNGKVDPSKPFSKKPKRELLTELRLARREAEFQGGLSILCQPQNAPSLRHLVNLSLYDCQIKSLDGIGMLATSSPNLQVLDVGRNPITHLPNELADLKGTLKEFWCDDCQVGGKLPACIFQLENLETLRISRNRITSIHPVGINSEHGNSGVGMEALTKLHTLCLDRNEIVDIPVELSRLSNLKSLMIRQNKIESLPEGVPGASMKVLSLFHVSSNKLKKLPDSFIQAKAMENVYVNGNAIEKLPFGMAEGLVNLKRLNASSNKIERLSSDFVSRFGNPDGTTGVCEKDSSCVVLVGQNPVVERIKAKDDKARILEMELSGLEQVTINVT